MPLGLLRRLTQPVGPLVLNDGLRQPCQDETRLRHPDAPHRRVSKRTYRHIDTNDGALRSPSDLTCDEVTDKPRRVATDLQAPDHHQGCPNGQRWTMHGLGAEPSDPCRVPARPSADTWCGSARPAVRTAPRAAPTSPPGPNRPSRPSRPGLDPRGASACRASSAWLLSDVVRSQHDRPSGSGQWRTRSAIASPAKVA